MSGEFIKIISEMKVKDKFILSADDKFREKQLKIIKIINDATRFINGKKPFYIGETSCVYKVNDIVDKYTFEDYVAKYIAKKNKFNFIKVTKKTNDNGVDYYGFMNFDMRCCTLDIMVIGQIKFTTQIVGVKLIREFLQAGRSFFNNKSNKNIKLYILQLVITSELTEKARKEIEEDGQWVQVITLDNLFDMV